MKKLLALAGTTAVMASGLIASPAQAHQGSDYNLQHMVATNDIASCRTQATSLHNTVAAQVKKYANSTTRTVSESDYGCALGLDGKFYAAVMYSSYVANKDGSYQDVPIFSGDKNAFELEADNLAPARVYDHGTYYFATKSDCLNHETWTVNQLKTDPKNRLVMTNGLSDQCQTKTTSGYGYDVFYESSARVPAMFAGDVQQEDTSLYGSEFGIGDAGRYFVK